MLIIVAIALLLFLPGPWNLVGFFVVTVLWFGELYVWSRKVRSKPKTVGTQTLVGRQASVITACRPRGQVRVDGEIWEARCDAGASVGDSVRVVGIDGLTAVVEPV